MTHKVARTSYHPFGGDFTRPKSLALLEELFFEDVEVKTLKIKGVLFQRLSAYTASMVAGSGVDSEQKNQLAQNVLDAFSHIGFVKVDRKRNTIFSTGVKKGSILVNISKYGYHVPHLKGVVMEYTVLTMEDVLTGTVHHSFGQWDVEVDDKLPEVVYEHYLASARSAGVEKTKTPHEALRELIFALTPYRQAA